MTSKEALNVLVNNLSQARLQEASSSNYYWTKYEEVNEAIKVLENSITEVESIRQALTPPTEQEVREALNKWVSDNVEDAISNVMYGDNSFYYYDEDDYVECIVQKTFCGCLAFGINDLPLKIVGLITRFFEELERKDNDS